MSVPRVSEPAALPQTVPFVNSDLSLRIEPGFTDWTWFVTVERNGEALGPELSGRRLEWGDLEHLADNSPIERMIPRGKLVIWKTPHKLHLKIVARPMPPYLASDGRVGHIDWFRLVRAFEEVERAR